MGVDAAGNIAIAIISLFITAVWIRLYVYVRTPFLFLLALGFLYFTLLRALVVMSDFGAICSSPGLSWYIVGYVLVLIGSSGLLYYVAHAMASVPRKIDKDFNDGKR